MGSEHTALAGCRVLRYRNVVLRSFIAMVLSLEVTEHPGICPVAAQDTVLLNPVLYSTVLDHATVITALGETITVDDNHIPTTLVLTSCQTTTISVPASSESISTASTTSTYKTVYMFSDGTIIGVASTPTCSRDPWYFGQVDRHQWFVEIC
jgi:hypothetical protein